MPSVGKTHRQPEIEALGSSCTRRQPTESWGLRTSSYAALHTYGENAAVRKWTILIRKSACASARVTGKFAFTSHLTSCFSRMRRLYDHHDHASASAQAWWANTERSPGRRSSCSRQSLFFGAVGFCLTYEYINTPFAFSYFSEAERRCEKMQRVHNSQKQIEFASLSVTIRVHKKTHNLPRMTDFRSRNAWEQWKLEQSQGSSCVEWLPPPPPGEVFLGI